MIQSIIKRDGREVAFDIEKIANAIYQAAEAIGGKDYQTSMDLAKKVIDYIEEMYDGEFDEYAEYIYDLYESEDYWEN